MPTVYLIEYILHYPETKTKIDCELGRDVLRPIDIEDQIIEFCLNREVSSDILEDSHIL
ncbi:unnamed protein product [Meloidogyne enterolobii]|uniref:Uncharacterized protein n=1 Tax=Meloidogyne enterolobii TaxID=390850 RepID=A0ACB1A0C0_MELEN